MRRFHLLTIDQAVLAGVWVHTPTRMATALSKVDTLVAHAVVNKVGLLGGTLDVATQCSSDGRNWVTKSTSTSDPLHTSVDNSHVVSDTGGAPSLDLVRFAVRLNSISAAHVRLHVTGRDVRR